MLQRRYLTTLLSPTIATNLKYFGFLFVKKGEPRLKLVSIHTVNWHDRASKQFFYKHHSTNLFTTDFIFNNKKKEWLDRTRVTSWQFRHPSNTFLCISVLLHGFSLQLEQIKKKRKHLIHKPSSKSGSNTN
jgi:hypothetical protein